MTVTSRNVNWEQRQLGEIGTTYSGLSGKNKSDFEKGNSIFVTFLEVLNNPVLKNIDLTNKVEIKENEHQNKVKRNDILFNTSSETPEEVATSTVVDVNQDNLYLNSFCFGFRPNVQFSNYYIGYYLRSNHFRNRVFCLAQGISRYNISKKSLIKLKLSLPKLEEQDKISRIFNQIELLLTLYERKVKLLLQIKKYLLDNLFTEKDYPKLRFKGFTEAWEQRKLGKQNKITMGQSPSSKNYTDNPNDWILIQGNADLKNGKVTPRLYTSQVTKKADIGDIILTVRAPVGEVAITDYKVILGRGVASIKGNLFIYFALEKFKTNNKWNMYSSGSTFDSITGKDLNNLALFFPSKMEENKIGKLLNKLDSLLALYENKQKQLAQIKNNLLNTMFI